MQGRVLPSPQSLYSKKDPFEDLSVGYDFRLRPPS